MRTRIALAAVALPVLVVAGCGGGDDEDALPPTDKSSESTTNDQGDDSAANDGGGGDGEVRSSDDPKYAPKPKGAKLTEGERAAYWKALRDYDRWHAIAERLNRHPRTTKAVQRNIINHTYSPYTQSYFEKIVLLKERGLTEKGRAIRHWRVPVSVELRKKHPTVTLLECIDTAPLKVIKKGKTLPPKYTKPFRSRTTLTADGSGLWRPTRSSNGKSCAVS